MSKKKKYLLGSAFTVFLIAYMLKPTIVVRENDGSRSIASIGASVEPKIDPNLLKATKAFCNKNFHRDSCVSYLNKCGVECLDFLSEEAKEKLRADAQTIAK